jgi:hypothetical protein
MNRVLECSLVCNLLQRLIVGLWVVNRVCESGLLKLMIA